jgi:DNA polymerase-3 subunit alpha
VVADAGIADPKDFKRHHLTVWAKNWDGVKSIMSLLTLANRQFYRRPLLSISQALGFESCMVGTACSFGILAMSDWEEIGRRFHSVYGEDFYAEIMPHKVEINEGEDAQAVVNMRAMKLRLDLGVQLLATNDSHYTLEEDAEAHNVLMATQYKHSIREHEGWPPVFFMRSMLEMAGAFKALEYIPAGLATEAMINTIRLAEKVNIEKPKIEIMLPSIKEDDEAYMMERIMEGWARKIKGRKIYAPLVEYRKRLIYEVEVIKKVGFCRYFIMVEDAIRWARERGIMVGPGRGSAAGSLVCYLMDITQADPIRHGLYFERFLNPERIELPDIDVDFQDNRRDEVFRYIVDKYGAEKVGRINTFTELGPASAFRDVCRAYEIDISTVNQLSKQIVDAESFETAADLIGFAGKHPELMKHVKRLTGVIRGSGVHACGVCISSEPLERSCVMERRNDGVFVSNWDKDQCEKFGLLKMDLLGLTTLSILRMAAEDVEKAIGVKIDFENPDLSDAKTLEAFSRGECAGVFQFESHGMQDLLRQLKAKDFETLVATTALYRPGPLNSGLTGKYVRIAKGDEYPYYPHPVLEPCLAETHSVIVYQEQIMRVFADLAGFTWAEADKMRKIIGKKLGDAAFEEHRQHFVQGCLKKGVSEAVSGPLFDQMKEFAAYSFNKSHAVAYTIISFWSMWFKVNFPGFFLAAYMSCVHDDDGKIVGVRESRRLNVPLVKPDINVSSDRFVYDHEENRIFFPLSAIKGVGSKAVSAILKARRETECGVFLSLDDMLERLPDKRAVNIGVVDKLTRAGAFESLGLIEADAEVRERNTAELLPVFEAIPRIILKRESALNVEQLDRIKAEIVAYAEGVKRTPLLPSHGSRPVVMVVNSQVKGEAVPGTHRGVLPIFAKLKAAGIGKHDLYYTTICKFSLEKPSVIPKDLHVVSIDWLRQEIAAVKPKLIYCCTNDAVSLFQSGAKLTKLYGCIKYDRSFESYVLFGPSPQYAGFRPEEVGGVFDGCMEKIAEIFLGD